MTRILFTLAAILISGAAYAVDVTCPGNIDIKTRVCSLAANYNPDPTVNKPGHYQVAACDMGTALPNNAAQEVQIALNIAPAKVRNEICSFGRYSL